MKGFLQWVIQFIVALISILLISGAPLLIAGFQNLFLGGTLVSYDPMFGDPPKSIAYEWAGLFGNSFRYLQGAPWLPLAPAISFALVILAIAAMIEGYTRAANGQVNMKRRKKMKYVSEEVVEWNQQQLKEKLVLLQSSKNK